MNGGCRGGGVGGEEEEGRGDGEQDGLAGWVFWKYYFQSKATKSTAIAANNPFPVAW